MRLEKKIISDGIVTKERSIQGQTCAAELSCRCNDESFQTDSDDIASADVSEEANMI